MAVDKIIKGSYAKEKDIQNVVHYILNVEKCPHGILSPKSVTEENIKTIRERFVLVQKKYRKTNYKRIQHIIISFDENEIIDFEQYVTLCYAIADYFRNNYQIVFALHEKGNKGEKVPPHMHIGLNPISYINGERIKLSRPDIKKMKLDIRTIISENSR